MKTEKSRSEGEKRTVKLKREEIGNQNIEKWARKFIKRHRVAFERLAKM